MKSCLLKTLSLSLCVVLLFGFAACGKPRETVSQSSTVQEVSTEVVSSTVSETNNYFAGSGGGARPSVTSAFAFYEGGKPTIVWRNLVEKEGHSAKVVIKDLNGKTVFEESGIRTNTYVLKKELTHRQQYKLYVYYFNEQGKDLGLMGGIYEDGLSVTYYKKATKDSKYYFDGGITLDALNHYLNRAFVFVQALTDGEYEVAKESIKTTGAKYIQRAGCMWITRLWEYNTSDRIKRNVAEIHSFDPEIIFEACIFECVGKTVNDVPIPAYVFEAFGIPVENRNFDFEKMTFATGRNKWGENTGTPDITTLEAQMWFYHRAVFYIDMGFEALHLGQVGLIGKNDTNYACFTKVVKMIRDYAYKNARRHYVIINGHQVNQKFIGTDGIMLADFNAFPARFDVAKGETDHKATEDNPQKCQIYPGTGDAVYRLNIVGTSTSGWYCTKYPYLAEIDNYSLQKDKLNLASANIWGYDEITWYAYQPQWYRRQFFEELTKQIDSFNENGHLSAPGRRPVGTFIGSNGSYYYYAASKEGNPNYYGDLAFYRDMWNRLGK